MLISTNTGIHSAMPGQDRVPMEETIAFCKKVGFEAVDVNFCATIYREHERHEPILDGDDWRDRVRLLRRQIEDAGLVVSHTHLPFYKYDNTEHPDSAYREEMMARSIEASAIVGAKWAVIHPNKDDTDEGTIERTIKTIRGYLKAANDLGVGLALENLTKAPYPVIIQIVDAFRAEGFNIGICYDTGHANRIGTNQYEALTAIGGDRLKTLHIHDNFGVGDDHLPPPFGTIVWADFYRGLKEIGYKGTFNYEVSVSRLSPSTREEMGRYLVKNAKEMIEKIEQA